MFEAESTEMLGNSKLELNQLEDAGRSKRPPLDCPPGIFSVCDQVHNMFDGNIFFSIVLMIIIPLAIHTIFTLLNVDTVWRFLLVGIYVSLVAGLYSMYILWWILKQDEGTPEMQAISKTIIEGSEGFFAAQYGTIFKMSFVFCGIIVVIYFTRDNTVLLKELNNTISNQFLALFTGFCFMLGALCSALSGYAGLWVSVRANLRCASAATRCYNTALLVAFKGGYFAAVINVALAIFGVCVLYGSLYIGMIISGGKESVNVEKIPLLLIGFGFGASFVAMFAQLGGGIYTKAADVGADLIGKVEAGIPEDDPRNPATIADLVGDNVGDCAGQAADLFESIAAEMLSAMILGADLAEKSGMNKDLSANFVLFPVALHC